MEANINSILKLLNFVMKGRLMKDLSKVLSQVQPSQHLRYQQKAKELKAQGQNVISLSIGEPDFDTPQNIKDAAIARINAGNNGYTAASGAIELKKGDLR